MSEFEIQLGDFAFFGFVKDPKSLLNVISEIGFKPRVLDFGAMGHFFFYSSWGEVAELEEAIALKLGFVRTPTMSPLSAHQLLKNKLVTPDYIQGEDLRGNAVIGCFSKNESRFSVYQTLMAPPPLYYTCLDEGLLCATDIRCLFPLLEKAELNERAVLMHFLFAFPIGPMTYFRGVRRLWPGQLLRWREGDLNIQRIKDLRLSAETPRFDCFDTASLKAYYEYLGDIMQVYGVEIEKTGCRLGSLLSGGIDSSALQLIMNERVLGIERRSSFSYATQAESFEFEIAYAKHASELLQTQHTYHSITSDDFPGLLTKAIETLGQPNVYNESTPCHLALAEFLASKQPDLRYLFSGQGADGLHGISVLKKIRFLELAKKVPGARLGLQGMAALLTPLSASKAHGLQEVAKMLPSSDNSISSTTPTVYVPTNYVATAVDLEKVRRCFGDREILNAFEYRLSLEEEYLDSNSLMEKVQIIELLTATYEPAVVMTQIYASQHKEPVLFFLDEDVVRMTFAFRPQVRLLRRMRPKPILRWVLEQGSLSELAAKKKGGSIFSKDLYAWMKQGPLQERVQAIDRPNFISKSDFAEIIRHPDIFLWDLLTFDIFKKQILRKLG